MSGCKLNQLFNPEDHRLVWEWAKKVVHRRIVKARGDRDQFIKIQFFRMYFMLLRAFLGLPFIVECHVSRIFVVAVDWMANLKADKQPLPTMEDILELRSNEELYVQVMNQFVAYVVLKLEWNERLRSPLVKSMGQLATISDEALALLILENNYDRWMDILKKNRWRAPQKERGASASDKRILSHVRPKYTHGGNFYQSLEKSTVKNAEATRSAATEKKGWTDEGVKRFNELRQQVVRDRSNPTNHGFFAKLKEEFNTKPGSTRKKQRTKQVAVIADIDPFSEDEEEQEGKPHNSDLDAQRGKHENDDAASLSGDDDVVYLRPSRA